MKLYRGWLRGWVCAIACAQASFGASEDDKAAALRGALATRSVVTFAYKGRERTVEPHALGKAGEEKPALLAWQTSGGSNTEPPPGWRVFIVAEMAGLKVTDKKFAQPRAGYVAKARGMKSIEADVSGRPATESGAVK